MDVKERFLRYVTFDTQSDEASATVPTTAGQLVFAEYLRQEMVALGLTDVELCTDGYLYATVPATVSHGVPAVGFIAHLDTSPDMSGRGVRPRVVEEYDGTDILLCAAEDIVLSPDRFPELLAHRGEDLIVTDGHTLLGADDKAGVAEIMTAAAYLMEHPEIPHGPIRIGFTPDEEVGRGAAHFDVEKFGCAWAYTVDGGEVGELEYENFNAAAARVTARGRNVHPGYAKGKMLNALLALQAFLAQLPAEEIPAATEGYEGFYHLTSMEGGVEQASCSLIVRDHDRRGFERRKSFLTECAARLNAAYGEAVISVELHDQYYNMREKVEPCMHIVRLAAEAMEAVGVTPHVKPIRGGTDGAQLSFRGLPCPNLFAGGLNFHGRYEFVPVQSMQKAVQVIVRIAALAARGAAGTEPI